MSHSRNEALGEGRWKMNRLLVESIFSQSGQGAAGRVSITLAEGKINPIIGDTLGSGRVFCQDRCNGAMNRREFPRA
jgi:hypothetical protein